MKVLFEEAYCKGCELCVKACPKNIIVMAKHLNSHGFHPATVIDQDACTLCCSCARMCPDSVITIQKGDQK